MLVGTVSHDQSKSRTRFIRTEEGSTSCALIDSHVDEDATAPRSPGTPPHNRPGRAGAERSRRAGRQPRRKARQARAAPVRRRTSRARTAPRTRVLSHGCSSPGCSDTGEAPDARGAGRPRSERAEQSIIEATIEALAERGKTACTARTSRRGRCRQATLYRRWGGRRTCSSPLRGDEAPAARARGESVRATWSPCLP